MDAFVTEVEAEGAVVVAVNELAGAFGEDGGDVAGLGLLDAVVVDGRVFVLAWPKKLYQSSKPGRRSSLSPPMCHLPKKPVL